MQKKQRQLWKNSEETKNAIEEFEQNRGTIDEWCNLAPESEAVRLYCIEELQARPPDHENVQENVPDYARQANAATEVRAIREPPAIDPTLSSHMYQNLNQKQACVFYAVRDWCIKLVCGLNSEQFFFYINGGAGTGKSHLIKCIYSDASKMPRTLKPPSQGLGNELDEVRCELLNAELIIIDEVSMVSKQIFAYVDVRLKQIKGSQKPFRAMSVIAVGDFYQLPPVRQSKPLCVQEPLEIYLWRHFEMITLT